MSAQAPAYRPADHNVVARFVKWLTRLPIDYALMIMGAIFVQVFYWAIYKVHAMPDPSSAVELARGYAKEELLRGLGSLLTPAQREFASNHIVQVILDAAAAISDSLYVWTEGNPQWTATGQITVIVSAVVAFRVAYSTLTWITALAVGWAMATLGRYHFHLTWMENRVPEASGTWFAVAWQSRRVLRWWAFIFFALPYGMYLIYPIITVSYFALVSYALARTMTDRL
ncbi:MAG: hypothetical protein D6771_09505 [Zetaproteobacteria bacterium]|nr:MAG: hypothetical protein D6771_09505 [Zetaproteobacteria bacterium]